MTMYEFVLFVMGNHYYVIYFLFMSYIYFFFDSLRMESDLITIRIGTLRSLFFSRVISSVFQTMCFVGMHVIIAMILGGIKLPHNNRFMASSIEGYYNDTLDYLFQYAGYISTPFAALVITVIYMVIGLVFISMLLYTLESLIGKKGAILSVGIGIFDIMLGFKLGVSGFPELFFLNNYFIFHHVLFMSGKIYAMINVVCMPVLLALEYYFWKRKWKNQKIKCSKDSYICEMQRNNLRYSMIYIFCYVCLCSLSVLLTEKNIAPIDIIFSCVLGYSAASFDFMEFLRYILFFAIPVFAAGIIIENENNMIHQQAAIRYKNKKIWKKLVNKQINIYFLKYVMSFCASVFIISILVFLTGKYDSSKYISDFMQFAGIDKEVHEWTAAAFFIKILELLYYKNIFFFWNHVIKNRAAAYVVSFLGFILDIIFPESMWVSYGSSSVYSLVQSGAARGMLLTLAGTFFVIFIKLLVIRKVNTILEGRSI
ncbi:MAG: hypothetical protein LUH14_09610 [Clostridiaceae bacterium]|nr:hypothetical protein [Clostridiaceae bacterium]